MQVQKKEIVDLKNEVEMLKQESKSRSIIISGVKPEDDLTTEEQVMKICKEQLQVNLHPMNCDEVYRLKKKREMNQLL